MKLALAQMKPVTGDLRGNVDKILREIDQAKGKADVVAFPEMAITGYCISDLIEDNAMLAANKKALARIAAQSNGVATVVGFIDYDPTKTNNDGRIRKYNAAAVLQHGKVAGVAHKVLLPNYRYYDDKRYFTPGEERRPIPITINGKQVTLGISICEDMWDDDYDIKPVKELAHKGADVIININASPFVPGKRIKREALIKGHVQDTGLPFVYVNTVGAADNGKNIIPFDGQSLVFNRHGERIAIGRQFGEELLFTDLESRLAIEAPEVHREKEIFEALVMSIRDYARQTGFKRVIEPVSGGIDSALGIAICAEAFGPENVIGYNLPSRFNTVTTKGIAERLAHNLGVEYKAIPIQAIDDLIRATFEANAHEIKNKVAEENLHARIRGMFMMLESNDTGALLVSNGNKTEIALGYATLYGDMCGGISVIGDLSKVDVYRVARYVNERHGREIIPKEAFTIKPSAELSEGQFDPFDYYVTAPIVDEFIENRMDPKELVERFREKKLDPARFVPDPEGKTIYEKYDADGSRKLVYDTYRLFKNAVYKRQQGAPIIAVTNRALGFDLRETLINKWDGEQ